jgi:hypothetical protein
MCRLRRLALSAGFLLSFVLIGCGLNPQPEPPSADEVTSGGAGTSGQIDPGPIGRVDPDEPPGPSGALPPADAGSSEQHENGEHHASDDLDNAKIGDPYASGAPSNGGLAPAPEDAGAREPAPVPPREDAGSVAN